MAEPKNPEPISTYVFLDFESTGLLDPVGKPRITELCLLAVNHVDMQIDAPFPRVTNKLTVSLDPQKAIPMLVSNITGLYNDSLEHQKTFTADTVKLISSFLDHLAKPVCLLAHNGNGFDFPLLVSELKRINQSLDSSLLCADTLEAFRSLDGLPCRPDFSTNQRTPIKTPPTSENKLDPPAIKRKSEQSVEPSTTPKTAKLDHQNEILATYSKTQSTVSCSSELSDNSIVHNNASSSQADAVRRQLHFEERNNGKEDNTQESENESQENANSGSEFDGFSASIEDQIYIEVADEAERKIQNNKEQHKDGEHLHVFSPGIAGDQEYIAAVGNTEREVQLKNQQPIKQSDLNVNVAIDKFTVSGGTGYFVVRNDSQHSTCGNDGNLKNKEAKRNDGRIEQDCQTDIKNLMYENIGQKSAFSDLTDKSAYVMMNDDATSSNNSSSSTTIGSAHPTRSTEVATANTHNLPPSSTPTTANTHNLPPSSTPTTANTHNLPPSSTPTTTNTSLSSSADTTTNTDNESSSSSSIKDNTPKSPSTTAATTENLSSSFLSSSTSSSSTTAATTEKPTSLSSSTLSSSSSAAAAAAATSSASTSPVKQVSYKLEEIFFRMFGRKPPKAHRAEDDCITLVHVAKNTPRFIHWVTENAVPFSSIEPPY